MSRPTVDELAQQHAAKRLNKRRRNAELRRFGYDPDGDDGKRYREAFHNLIAPQAQTVALWVFPPQDFDAWRETCHEGGPIQTHEQYMAQIDALQRDVESRGMKGDRREMRVSGMLAALKRNGWANTSENRARIIAGETPVTIGLKITSNAIGSAATGRPSIASGETPLRQGESHTDAARRAMDGD